MTELEQKALLDSVKNQVKEQLEAAQKGLVTVEALKSIEEAIAKLSAENPDVKKLTDEVATLTKAMADQNVEFKALKEKGMKSEENQSLLAKFEKDVAAWIESDEYKNWSMNPKGASPELNIKYALTSGSTGTVMTTQISPVVSDLFVQRKSHVRDLMTVLPTDMANLVFDRVTSWVPGADTINENGNAPTFDITTAEQTTAVKRISGIMDISNNSLRSKAYLTRHILAMAPERLANIEDFQVLFGDGTGNNLDGIYKNATTFDLTGATFIAGAVASVASYESDAKALITFAAAHGLTNAFTITFANATAARYNAAMQVNVKNDKQIVVTPVGGYIAEASTSAWTATSKHYLYGSIDGAQEYDVLVASKAFMAGSEYMPTGFILNPATTAKLELLKTTTLEYVFDIKRVNGVLFIAGLPVVEHNSMPADRFLVGDFVRAVELLQYESTTLRFVEDVNYVKANKQALYITEQILLPIFNPFMFCKGSFSTAKTALETA